MKEILFRGKRKDAKKWAVGSYLFLNVPDHDWTGKETGTPSEVHFIVDEHDVNYAVDPETVGQFTGLCDKNGKKIFVGDILSYDCYDLGDKSWYVAKIQVKDSISDLYMLSFEMNTPLSKNFKIIGNIHDNPELIDHAH